MIGFALTVASMGVIHLAQANPPAAGTGAQASRPTANWIGNDAELLKYIQESVAANRRDFFSIEARGPLGIPSLAVEFPIDLAKDHSSAAADGAIAQGVSPALTACVALDIEARQAGGWGPQCKIVEFLAMPAGKFERDPASAREWDYLYTPKAEGRDTLRFILENGAGRKVDVTLTLSITSVAEGCEECEEP